MPKDIVDLSVKIVQGNLSDTRHFTKSYGPTVGEEVQDMKESMEKLMHQTAILDKIGAPGNVANLRANIKGRLENAQERSVRHENKITPHFQAIDSDLKKLVDPIVPLKDGSETIISTNCEYDEFENTARQELHLDDMKFKLIAMQATDDPILQSHTKMPEYKSNVKSNFSEEQLRFVPHRFRWNNKDISRDRRATLAPSYIQAECTDRISYTKNHEPGSYVICFKSVA